MYLHLVLIIACVLVWGICYHSRSPRVCVFMLSTPEVVPKYTGIAAKINKVYCETHGYTFKHFIEPIPGGQGEIAWARVQKMRDLLADGTWDAVFYIDGDAVFNDHTISLAPWIQLQGDIIACNDRPNGVCVVNGGTMLLKNTAWTRAFLDKWQSMKSIPRYQQFAFEQKAFHDLYHSNWNTTKTKIHQRPAWEFNSVWYEVVTQRKRTGFVVHLMSSDAAYRRKEFCAIAQRLGIAD